MIMQGITKNNGDLLNTDRLVLFLGYQIHHKITGRILPQTDRMTVYSPNAAIDKLNEVGELFEDLEGFDITEYEFVPIYDIEMEKGWYQITHEKDW